MQVVSKYLKALLYYPSSFANYVLDLSKKLLNAETGVTPAVIIEISSWLVAYTKKLETYVKYL